MDGIDQGQVSRSAAEVYEEYFVPALFHQWVEPVAAAAGLQPNQRVLDIACGTGVLARGIAERNGRSARVVGLDINEGMLAVARRLAPHIEWQHSPAEALPFPDESFDTVVSQFGLMFFDDRRAAITEMLRVLRPGGRLAVAVWASLDETPGYAAMADLLKRLFGEEVASLIRSPFLLGDERELRTLFAEAGLPSVELDTLPGKARFPSLEGWVFTDIKGWTLADVIDDEQYQLLLAEAHHALRPFVNGDGSVTFDAPAHIVTFTKV